MECPLLDPVHAAVRPLRSQPTRDRILLAARKIFASDGYERTTIRAVATEAAINPAMVMRYYGDKDGLFAAAVAFDLRLPDLSAVPFETIGRTLARHVLTRWEGEGAGDELPALLRAAASHPAAQAKATDIFDRQLLATLNPVIVDPAQAVTCAALIASQVLGLAFTRYVLRLPAVVAIPRSTVIERVGATLQSYVDAARSVT